MEEALESLEAGGARDRLEEDIEALLKTAAPPPDEEGLLDTSEFVATVARQLGGHKERQ